MTDDDGVAGRRERKKAVTRAAIREAAMRLSLRDGVENVTLEQITAEADIARRTFFHYFSSKEEAVVTAAAGDYRAFIDEFRARPRTESILQALRAAGLLVLDRILADRREHIAVLLLVRRERTLAPQLLTALAAQEAYLAEAITERLGQGSPTDDADVYPALCAAAALAAMRVTLDRWLAQAKDPDDAPPMEALRSDLDRALSELAAGLDRPGSPEA